MLVDEAREKANIVVLQLRTASTEIAEEGHAGWGNACLDAADLIESLSAQVAEAKDYVSAVDEENHHLKRQVAALEHKLVNQDWYCAGCKQRYSCPPDHGCSRASCPECQTWMLNYQEYRANAAEAQVAELKKDAAIGRLVRQKLISHNSIAVERCTVLAKEVAEQDGIWSPPRSLE